MNKLWAGPLLALLCACSTPSAQPTTSAVTATATPAASDPTGARAAFEQGLPLDAYELKGDSSVARAEAVVAARCMKRLGFTATPVAPDEPFVYEDVPNRTTGYHWVPKDPAYLTWQKAIDAYQSEQASSPPTAAYLRAYYGTRQSPSGGVGGHDGGCAGEAETAVGGSEAVLSGVDPLVKSIDLDTDARADASAAVIATAKQWSACMAASGYHYRTPLEAMQDPQIGDSPDASPGELVRARDDIACQTRFHYWTVRHATLVSLQSQAIQGHSEALAHVAATRHAEIVRAARILAQR